MKKNISIRPTIELMQVFARYDRLTGENDSRPKAVEEWLRCLSELPESEETAALLRAASTQRFDEDVASIPGGLMKISIEIEPEVWEKALSLVQHVFHLKNTPQMRFLLRLAGTVYIDRLDDTSVIAPTALPSAEEFSRLSVDEKLDLIYQMLLRR